MIVVDDITKKYKDRTVLRIPKLEIPQGQCFGLVGNNGAGKTTFFSLLLDLIQPSQGQITNAGIQVNNSEEWKAFTASFLDESFLISYLSTEEYFYFIGQLRGQSKAQINHFMEEYEDFFDGDVLGSKKYLRDLSKGNQKKVGIIATLIGHPELIILDEPFANLDPRSLHRLKKIIANLVQNPKISLLVSSHDLQHIVEVCQRIVVLNKGEIVKDLMTSKETLQELELFFAD